MGLVRYAVAAGIGYYAGRPEGRRQLMEWRRQATEFVRGPEAKRLRERGWDLVGDGALATRNLAGKARSKVRSSSSSSKADSAGRHQADDATAGFNGTTVAEDSKAALLGLSTPPPADPPQNRS